MQIVKGAESLFEQLKLWRRYIHQHPELSFEEKHTSAFIISELNKMDHIKVEENVGGYGVVATLTTGTGPVIALRADFDALPILEENEHEFVSKYEGVMHACGHDAHTAILLGTAKLRSEERRVGKERRGRNETDDKTR